MRAEPVCANDLEWQQERIKSSGTLPFENRSSKIIDKSDKIKVNYCFE